MHRLYNLLRGSLAVLLIGLISFDSSAQEDTSTVQLIEFSDGLDKRRAWHVFPPSDNGKTYRKVEMIQTLKCDPALINNPTGSGCGEWDAGANFFFYDHSHKDSLRYRMDLGYPEHIEVTAAPTNTYYQEKQYFIVYDVVGAEATHTLGTGNQALDHALKASLHGGRAQYLYTASELTSAGLTAGSIDKLTLDITGTGSSLKGLTIRMKHSGLSYLSANDHETENLETVYYRNTSIPTTGLHTFNLTHPFQWDGTSNVVIDLSFNNKQVGSDFTIAGHATGNTAAVYADQDDQYMEFDNDYIEVSTDNMAGMLDTSITVSFWTYISDTSHMTSNVATFGAVNSNNTWKLLNRMPVGNGRLFFYAGNTTGLTNVSTPDAFPKSQFLGWNHWAFVKNGVANTMSIYFNGEEIATNTPNAGQLMDEIVKFRIGASRAFEKQYFKGGMNEFRIWNTALDSTTIRDWMHQDVTPSHPQYSRLIGYYPFDGSHPSQADDETGISSLNMFGIPERRYVPGWAQNRNLSEASARPNITFTQGTYTSHIDSIIVTDTVPNEPISIVVSQNELDLNLEGMQDVEIDTIYVWPANVYTYTYDPNGVVIDSMYVNPDSDYRNWYTGASRRVAKYITAYGNFLDLGDGFTWVYDFTDLQTLFRDTIDFRGGDSREIIDLSFRFIEGTPPRTVNKLEMLEFGGSYDDFVNNPSNHTQTITPDPNSNTFGITASFTGHGFNNAPNCSEFCRRQHFFNVDGQAAYYWYLWKECSDNPLYPQGGTWIYDRTGWCPGAPVDEQKFDITNLVTPGVPASIRKGVEADPTGTQFGNWNGYVHFFSYGEPNFDTDAEVYDVLAPNTHSEFLRFNPICANPVIVLRNSGGEALTEAKIEYGIEGSFTRTYTWTGNLDFLEKDTVTLPSFTDVLWNGIGDKGRFVARILEANGGADEHTVNDAFYTNFEPVPSYDSTFVILLQTNQTPEETHWDLRDHFGNVLYSRFPTEVQSFYWDTISLQPGCYTFNIYDSDDDGLDFWANNDGVGSIRFRRFDGFNFLTLDPDFGDHVRHQFTVGELNNTSIDEIEQEATVNLFPNPARGEFQLLYQGFEGDRVQLRVYDSRGVEVVQKQYANNRDGSPQQQLISLDGLPNGIYQVVLTDGQVTTRRTLANLR